MKRFLTAVFIPVIALSYAIPSFAADMKKGTIKGINEEERTIVFCPAGTEDHVTMAVGKTVNLSNFKADMLVKIYTAQEDGKTVIRTMKPDKHRVIQGC